MNKDENKYLELTDKNVLDIYKDCVFNDEDVIDGRPNEKFTIVKGVGVTLNLKTSKLNKHKPQIIAFFDKLPDTNEPLSMLEFCMDKNANQWTEHYQTVEQLIQLGIATELLDYYPTDNKKDWALLPGGLPFITKQEEKRNTIVEGLDPNALSPNLKTDDLKKAEELEKKYLEADLFLDKKERIKIYKIKKTLL